MSKSGAFFDARDIFGDRIKVQGKRHGSAGSAKQREGISVSYSKASHKEDNIDKIVKEHGQATGYAEWQKERYSVKVEHKSN